MRVFPRSICFAFILAISCESISATSIIDKVGARQVEDLLLENRPRVNLKGNGEDPRWAVDIEQLRVVLSIHHEMLYVSELDARLFVYADSVPNAVAVRTADGSAVLINTAMIQMLGYHRDAWASLLGHELAHIKLKHGEVRGSAQKKQQEADYLGIIWTIEADYSPYGGVFMFKRFYEEYGNRAFSNSGRYHLLYAERLNTLLELAERMEP